MIYGVIITPNAEQDLREAYPEAAGRWIKSARRSIKTLARNPGRCPMAPESRSFEEPIRELLCGTGNRGTYRVLFVIMTEFVYVLHVRHGSMDELHSKA